LVFFMDALHPLLILAIGIITILVLIVALRTNAFVALITAAMLVSVLAPGEPHEKFSRVAVEFGRTAGDIGIAIGLAAIIGQCLMQSGAADRIVRSFLRLFGEKRAGWALMGSSYLLGIPVFFDTLFYLMAPLARALYKQTGKNFLLYVLAISAGGAITHTLVPPTPGPLVVAGLLGVDLGVMILVGIAVSAPVAVIGLGISALFNRAMPVPARELPGMKAHDPLPDHELPGLFVSVLPVILPVILIGASTLLTSLARREFMASTAAPDVFAAAVTDARAKGATPPRSLAEMKDEQSWLAEPRTPLQEAARGLRLLGDPMFALFLAAVIAMIVLVRTRKQTLSQLAETVEVALMNGGLIILIVAAGGAFGAMIGAAGVGDAITASVGQDGATGAALLLLVFGVTSIIKIAQGSSTVAMITAAGIVNSMLASGAELPFDLVYVALAIGCGSLVCSWMNDAGFWIVAKMSGLTELETLKAWMGLLALMGFVGLGVVLIYVQVLPFPFGRS
jgi:GntP family gluconate:H+ symporter